MHTVKASTLGAAQNFSQAKCEAPHVMKMLREIYPIFLIGYFSEKRLADCIAWVTD